MKKYLRFAIILAALMCFSSQDSMSEKEYSSPLAGQSGNSAPGFPDEFNYLWPPSARDRSPNLLWRKIQWEWKGGLVTENVWTEEKPENELVILVDEGGRGGQINSESSSYHYGMYKASIKASRKTESDSSDPKGVCNGFFVYWQGDSEDHFEEIDVEILSREPDYVYFTIWRGRKLFYAWREEHWVWSKKVKVRGRTDKAYHVYGFNWLPERVEFFVDNFEEPAAVYHESDEEGQHIPSHPATLIINNWTGEKYWSGDPPGRDRKMHVEWVNHIPLLEEMNSD